MSELLTTTQLARKVDWSPSGIHYWVRKGYLVPVAGGGVGEPYLFDADGVALAEAIAETGLRKWLSRERQALTSSEVCAKSGLSFRRLDYWTRRGWITPAVEAEGSGNHRLWAPSILEDIADRLERIAACPFDHGEDA